ncbi:MAG: hypothetical protein OHK0039_37370 [Bacteroidia bacterium]
MAKYRPNFERKAAVNYAATTSRGAAGQVGRPARINLKSNLRQLIVVLGAIALTNTFSLLVVRPTWFGGSGSELSASATPSEELYLMDKASVFVSDTRRFENKVREIAAQLDVPPEWLMAVMYSESKFDAAVRNHKGSGATGLIQFMPAAASDLNVSLERLGRMEHEQQMEYVYLYLQNVRERYGEFMSLADLYLAILYPRALNQDYCYTLYAKPSQSYEQNAGLDENRDGRVTVSDIDRRMQRLYPTAYMVQK